MKMAAISLFPKPDEVKNNFIYLLLLIITYMHVPISRPGRIYKQKKLKKYFEPLACFGINFLNVPHLIIILSPSAQMSIFFRR